MAVPKIVQPQHSFPFCSKQLKNIYKLNFFQSPFKLSQNTQLYQQSKNTKLYQQHTQQQKQPKNPDNTRNSKITQQLTQRPKISRTSHNFPNCQPIHPIPQIQPKQHTNNHKRIQFKQNTKLSHIQKQFNQLQTINQIVAK